MFIKELTLDAKDFRKFTYEYEQEMLQYLNIDSFDNLSIKQIKEILIGKRDSKSVV